MNDYVFTANSHVYSNTGFKQWYCPHEKFEKIVKVTSLHSDFLDSGGCG